MQKAKVLTEHTRAESRVEHGSRHRQAGLAGVFYVVVVATGTFSLGVAPAQIFVADTPQALA
jgi:hypothetical protein